ncbi:MAG: putative zinc-binding protein [Methanobacterium sp.]|nr:putative zinc-binding protein [Methanobacterium sp.]
MKNKIAISPCTGMSPYGLISRVVCLDTIQETENTTSICITATSADKEGFRSLIKKYPIIAVNGCENACVDKILKQKGVKTIITLNITEILNKENLKPSDTARLNEKDEKSVKLVKTRIKEILDNIY